MEYARPELLAEPEWLAAHLDDPAVRIIDCASADAYRRAHIRGAVELPTHRFIKEDDAEGSDHGVLVMAPAEFAALMGRLGVGPDTTVVTYDDSNSMAAARLWWTLAYYGHANARVLNGGWQRWLNEGREIAVRPFAPAPATFVATPNPAMYATLDELKESHADSGCQVMDVRSDGEWAGTNDRGNRRAGHVPNAHHLEWLRFVRQADSPTFRSADEIQELLDGGGISRERPTITYCQGGIRAAHTAFVLALMGYEGVRVYDGSMREWANREDTPLVR